MFVFFNCYWFIFNRSLTVITDEEKVLCHKLANHVICMNQCNLLLSPFPLICLIFSQPSVRERGVHFNQLVDYVYWLEELIRRTGATPYHGLYYLCLAILIPDDGIIKAKIKVCYYFICLWKIHSINSRLSLI